ncbi:single-stranded DNA-binding protein 2 [Kroppenstedtia guangzhouensis]|uniref:Single-stranded DNA-binding protein n=1 Tax=Kroppenstedtia guangzhouensis TaxID=1274356 RepID=A0ABQ1H2R5_9BACL|nr:single-stranded DNA-binding protein [Kroppenstedtia guangzhouensis]GGA56680.1 single-stranded DNA-binding protein 2 [Kroppenstedtia guangzhouensis]
MIRATGIGRLVRDPELRYTPTGVAVANFTIASQRNRKDANGDYPADFIDCVAWRGAAEFIAKHTAKGSRISVDGRLETRTWEKDDGTKVKVTEIQVDNVDVIDWKEDRKKSGRGGRDPFVDDGKAIEINDDDLPF